MSQLWIKLPERARHQEEDAFIHALEFVLTQDSVPYNRLQSGEAYIDELPVADEVILIMSARDVLILEKTTDILSVLTGQRLNQALPSLLEDEVLYFDRNHVAIWRDPENSAHMAFAITDKGWLRQVLGKFNEIFKHVPVRVIPASYFQEVGSIVSLSNDDDHAGNWACFRKGEHETHLIPLQHNDFLSSHHLSLEQLIHTPLLNRISHFTDPYINLCQFEFADKHLGWRALWGKWKGVLIVLFVSLIIETLGINIYWLTLAYQQRQLLQEERQVAQLIIPQLPKDINPELVLRHEWQVANQTAPTSDKDFMVLCAKLAQIMIHQPTDAVTKIKYHQGELDVTLKPGVNIDMVKQDALTKRVTINSLGGGVWQIK
ncbi:GspL periplasmic domain protein [Ferrovum sp. JA12]|uniref:type II secretion system protein GspL n=1 Tax=Ferrovum sp. JA12 TaxID=1356299 RepID=UPI000703732D|nr:type II secretion system protein GspL [Ferrovum sp. JA12]KRH78282.1 GspL periplasmic domain protein [Ferrovum sp. JA12]